MQDALSVRRRVLAGKGIILRPKVGETRGLALSIYMIDTIKFHVAPLSQLVKDTESNGSRNQEQSYRNVPPEPRCEVRTAGRSVRSVKNVRMRIFGEVL